MRAAVEQVIACRVVLKYAYVIGYYFCADIANYENTPESSETESISVATRRQSKLLFEHQILSCYQSLWIIC